MKNQSKFLPIIMMILLFGMISFVTNLAAPMGIVLKEQFGVSNFQGMLGNAMNFIAYAVFGLPGGMLLQRIGYKKTALLAVFVGIIGIGTQFLSGHVGDSAAFSIYLLGAFIAGISMCLLNIVVNPMLNTLGGGGNKGNQLIQVAGSFNSLMATFTPAFVGVLIGEAVKAQITDVFPVLYIAMGVFALVFIVLALVAIPEPNTEKVTESYKTLISGVMKFRHFVLGAIAIGLYVGIEVGVPGTMNFWLSDSPVGKTTAGTVTGTYWLLMLVGRLLGAVLGGKISTKAMLSSTSALAIVFVLLAIILPTSIEASLPVMQSGGDGSLSFGFARIPINAMLLVLVGLSTSIMWGGIFNLAVEGLGKYTAIASGIFMTLVVGGGLLPLIQNFFADRVGYLPSYWVIIAALAYLLWYALAGCKNVNKDIPVE